MSKLPQPYIITSSPASAVAANVSAYALAAFPAANRALFIPFTLPSTQRIATVSVYAGGSGTFDLGIYEKTCVTKLASLGSTTLSANAVNTWTLTKPFLVRKGELFWLGLSASAVTATFVSQPRTVTTLRTMGVAQQTTAHPLPSPATPAQVASTFIPTFALTFIQ